MDDALLTRLQEQSRDVGGRFESDNPAKIAGAVVIRSEFDGLIIRLWKNGFNTHDIARYAKIDESVVANRFAQLRDSGAL